MRWFKGIEPTSEMMFPIFDKWGWEGYGLATAFLAEAYFQKLDRVTAQHLKLWLGVNKQKADKFLPAFEELLTKFWVETDPEVEQNLGKTDPKLTQNQGRSEAEVRQNLVTFDTSNPHGSIKDRVDKNRLEEIDKKEEIDNTPPTPPREECVNNIKILTIAQQAKFDIFWGLYPKKASKGAAERAWAKINPEEQLHNRILESLERAKTSEDWTKERGRFIPYPATWLNGKRWEDEPHEALSQPQLSLDVAKKIASFEEIGHVRHQQSGVVYDWSTVKLKPELYPDKFWLLDDCGRVLDFRYLEPFNALVEIAEEIPC